MTSLTNAEPASISGHDNINRELHARRPEPGLTIPPPCFVDMDGEFLNFDGPRRSLSARFPVHPRYANPAGVVQGGLLVTAVDNVMGPLCYLLADPSTTLTFEFRFARPILIGDQWITAHATADEVTRRFIHLSVHVTRDDGKIAMRGSSVFAIL